MLNATKRGYTTHAGRRSHTGGSVAQEFAGEGGPSGQTDQQDTAHTDRQRTTERGMKKHLQSPQKCEKTLKNWGHIWAGSVAGAAARRQGRRGRRSRTRTGRRPQRPPRSEIFGSLRSDPVAHSSARKTPRFGEKENTYRSQALK